MKHLITIEDLFEIPRRGIILVPDIPREQLETPFPQRATLISHEGAKRQVEIEFALMHFNPAQREMGYFCILKNMSKSEVEIGSEVWIPDYIS